MASRGTTQLKIHAHIETTTLIGAGVGILSRGDKICDAVDGRTGMADRRDSAGSCVDSTIGGQAAGSAQRPCLPSPFRLIRPGTGVRTTWQRRLDMNAMTDQLGRPPRGCRT